MRRIGLKYHLGLGREPIAKTTLATANQNRDYRIFEDFAFYMMKEACEKRTTNILDISGNKYAFDSTAIPLCLATFPWAKFRSKKGGVKAHVLYDIEAQVPAFYTVTTASKHDSTAMSSIHYEPNAYITYCLVAIVQHDMKLKRSTYEVLQILSISLTDKTHLRDLFDKTNFNDVKDLYDPLIPGVFD